MKFLIFSLLFILASCGQGGGSSSSSGKSHTCNLNGRSIACESIKGADGQGVDLLESMIDVPISMTDSVITFQADRSANDDGRRISCPTVVKSGETYRYTLRGDKLLIMTESGSFEMTRLNDAKGVLGSWMWKGYIDQGTHIIRQFSFLSQNRVIIRNSCEL